MMQIQTVLQLTTTRHMFHHTIALGHAFSNYANPYLHMRYLYKIHKKGRLIL